MKISGRNQLKGTIVDVAKGATTSHIRIDIGGGVVVTASITNESVDELKLAKGVNSGRTVRSQSNRRRWSRRGRRESERKPRSPMPAQCCRGKIARLNSGNSWSGYGPFAEVPGLSDELEQVGNWIAASSGGYGRGFPRQKLLDARRRQHEEKRDGT